MVSGPFRLLSGPEKLAGHLRGQSKLFANVRQKLFTVDRQWMRGAQDPTPVLYHVLHDGLGLYHVGSCVEIKNGSRRRGTALIETLEARGFAPGCRGGPWLGNG